MNKKLKVTITFIENIDCKYPDTKKTITLKTI